VASATVDGEVPEAVLELCGPRDAIRQTLSQSAVLELVRRGDVSSRRGAQLLSMDWLDFVRLMDEHGIDYFTDEMWQQDRAALDHGRPPCGLCHSRASGRHCFVELPAHRTTRQNEGVQRRQPG